MRTILCDELRCLVNNRPDVWRRVDDADRMGLAVHCQIEPAEVRRRQRIPDLTHSHHRRRRAICRWPICCHGGAAAAVSDASKAQRWRCCSAAVQVIGQFSKHTQNSGQPAGPCQIAASCYRRRLNNVHQTNAKCAQQSWRKASAALLLPFSASSSQCSGRYLVSGPLYRPHYSARQFAPLDCAA